MSVILSKLIKIFKQYKINYVISDNNLREINNGEIIPQIDNLNIRLDNKTFNNWIKYCNSIKNKKGQYIDYKNNLKFDEKIYDIKQQKINLIKIYLLNLEKDLGKPSKEILQNYNKFKKYMLILY